MKTICRDLKEFENKRWSPIDDINVNLSERDFFPKDIYILENKYYSDMPINPELKKYIDQTIEKEIKRIRKEILLTTEESLYELWDNEYDERWNEY